MIELKSRFAELFFKSCLKDDDILRVLKKKNYQISLMNVVRTRKKLDLLRKVMTEIEDENDEKLIDSVKEVFINHSVQIYEKKMLYYFFRTQSFLISR